VGVQAGRRRPDPAAHPGDDADLCKVDVVARGEFGIEQDGRQADLRAGDFTFVDLSRPAHWTNTWSSRIVAIAFPRKLLPLRADDLAGLTAVGLPGDDGTGALFFSTARQVARQLEHLDPAAGARVATATLDLLTVALAGRLDRVPPDGSQRALLLRVRAFIEAWLADPGWRPRPWPAPTTSPSARCTSCSRGSRPASPG
jgi:AraC-binding-like domain